MRLPAIGVLDIVVPGKVPAREHLAGAEVHVGVRRERDDRAPDEQRRLGAKWASFSTASRQFSSVTPK